MRIYRVGVRASGLAGLGLVFMAAGLGLRA